MRFTQHTAMKAAEQIAAGKTPNKIDPTELSSLEAYIAQLPAHTLQWLADLSTNTLKDREYRNPDQMNLISRIDEMLYEAV